MTKKLLILFLGATLAAAPFAGAAIRRGALTNDNGLSNSSVTCIYQDSSQLMWFGTWDGLNVYNGSGFRTYKFEPDNPNTISNNVIRNIVEEAAGIVWVATDYGINRIDTRRDRIDRFYPGYEQSGPAGERVFSVAASPDGEVFCAATGWGIARYDARTQRLAAFNIPHFNSSEIRGVYAPAPNTLLLHTVRGRLVRMRYALPAAGDPEVRETEELFPDGSVEALFECPRTIYAATADSTIFGYDRRTGGVSALAAALPPSKGGVCAAAELPDGRLAFAFGASGARFYDPVTRRFADVPELAGVNVLSLLSGSQQILWAGTDGQGVLELYEDDIEFNKTDNRRIFGGKSSPVRAFFEDGRGDMYVATKGNGIYVLRADGSPGGVYDRSNGLDNPFVYALAEGYGNDMLIGHDGVGIDVLDFSTGRISPIEPLEGTRFGSVYAIRRDPANGMLWLGTNGYGLVGLRLDRSDDGRYTIREQRIYVNDKSDDTSLGNNVVFSIAPAGDGRLWVGTRGGGLNLFDPRSGRFARYTTSSGDRPISSNDILSLYTGRDSTLWVGTGYGLNRLCRDADGGIGFERYTEKEGLPNNTIHGILEDDAGLLWLSTNKGLARLDPVSGQVVGYYKFKALQNNEFSDGAYYRGRDGKMYFGGVDGFNRFDPDNIRMRSYAPPVLINSFSVRQRPLSDFRADREIVLSHGENFFSIQFSALEYIRNESCEYAYILRGFDDDWVYAGTDNTAVFTNVPPGSYEFSVRATNGDKVWGDRVASLRIRVRPPWWNTTGAYVIYLLLAAGAVYAIYFIANERIEQRRRLLIESMTRRQQSDSYEAKLRFFTSVAHEFCTPLTLIYGSGEQLLSSYTLSPDVARHVRIVKNNAARMQRLIGELMDFRRVDTGHYEPRYTEVNVSELLSSIADNFNEVNGQRRIDLRMSLPEADVVIVSDRDALEKILYNLVSNAYKYTPVGGWIEMTLLRERGRTTFRIANSGKGIKPEDIANVFNRFEILDNFERSAHEGRIMRNGIGLALAQSLAKTLSGEIAVVSKTGESTTFTLSLPEVSRDRIVGTEAQAGAGVPLPEAEEETRTEAQPHDEGDRAVILVVDDEEQIRDLIGEILGGEYTVLRAADGVEAIDILKRRRPDLIISDISMPNLDGLGLLRYLKENEITRYIPFVFLTFKTDVEQEIHGYELGGEAYISKPFHPKHLLAVVHRILTDRQSLRNYYNSAISTSDVYEGSTIDADDKKFIVQLTRTIEENLVDENLSLNFLCDKMCVSRMGLYRKIKEITQMTPSEYIRSVKLKHATHLLRTTGMTIQEIMFCSGFNNKSYFYREFAKVYRMSPKEMREKER